jgi:lipopolysaccharide assembly outer membrane protein LptD (OstA)
MHLFGKGSIQYKELGLKAEKIDIDWTTSSLKAEGVPDSADTTGKGFKGLPDLIDGSETYKGTTVSYNFKTNRGRINLGETEVGDGFYSGEKIKKVDNDVLFVENGRYTTCELGHPHYYIASPEMKIVVKDQVVARQVYLYISDVPVFALPFGVFPSQSGRRSGLIVPAYGQSSRGRSDAPRFSGQRMITPTSPWMATDTPMAAGFCTRRSVMRSDTTSREASLPLSGGPSPENVEIPTSARKICST